MRRCQRAQPNDKATPVTIAALAGLVCWLLLTAGCSGTSEDVRITLCKDMTEVLLDGASALRWSEPRTEMQGVEDLVVDLRFESAQRTGRATCFYRHDDTDSEIWSTADPMAAYSTSPHRMTLNGREIANPLLAETIKAAMLKQGRALVERAQEGVEQAAQALQERLDGAR
jgi:hypothetical protein